MQRRAWLAGVSATGVLSRVAAQPGRRVPVVGVLLMTPLTAGMNAQTVATVRDELSRLGYPDGDRIAPSVRRP